MTITTGKIQERIAFAGVNGEDLAQKNEVVATVEDLLAAALDDGESAGEHGGAGDAVAVVKPGKALLLASGKALREVALRLV